MRIEYTLRLDMNGEPGVQYDGHLEAEKVGDLWFVRDGDRCASSGSLAVAVSAFADWGLVDCSPSLVCRFENS